jgi:hypothetical protein
MFEICIYKFQIYVVEKVFLVLHIYSPYNKKPSVGLQTLMLPYFATCNSYQTQYSLGMNDIIYWISDFMRDMDFETKLLLYCIDF